MLGKERRLAQEHMDRRALFEQYVNGTLDIGVDTRFDIEWNKQANRLVSLGFAEELGLSAAEYLNTLPLFEQQPKEYEGRFDIPLLVDPRVPLPRQQELLGATAIMTKNGSLDADKVQNFTTTPRGPYAVWTNQGNKFVAYSTWKGTLRDALSTGKKLDHDEVPCQLTEVMALAIQYPKLFEVASTLGAPASVYDESWNLMLTKPHWPGPMEISALSVGSNGLTRGRKIVTPK
jgi:hypothetical protein